MSPARCLDASHSSETSIFKGPPDSGCRSRPPSSSFLRTTFFRRLARSRSRAEKAESIVIRNSWMQDRNIPRALARTGRHRLRSCRSSIFTSRSGGSEKHSAGHFPGSSDPEFFFFYLDKDYYSAATEFFEIWNFLSDRKSSVNFPTTPVRGEVQLKIAHSPRAWIISLSDRACRFPDENRWNSVSPPGRRSASSQSTIQSARFPTVFALVQTA